MGDCDCAKTFPASANNHPQFIAESMLYPEGEDQNHMSIGAGIAWPRFQIDAAYDTSDTNKVGSLTVVTRF